MPRHGAPAVAALGLTLAIVAVSPAGGSGQDGSGQDAPVTDAAPRRVVAVGDIHGAYDEFVGLMQVTGLLGEGGAWAGGDTILVQTGDFTDRGTGVRAVMDLLMRMQAEAPQAGGEVRVALGNHEVMNFIGERRDVTPEIFATFATEDSEDVRDAAFDEYEDRILDRDSTWSRLDRRQRRKFEEDWLAEHPLGYVEYADALGPDGEYGRWIRSLPAIVVAEGVMFMHAGVHPAIASWGVDGLNARVAEELAAFDAYRAWLYDRRATTAIADLQEIIRGGAYETDGLDWLESRRAPWTQPPTLVPDLAAADSERTRFTPLFELAAWFLNTPEGPLWFRGYASWTEEEGVPAAAGLLDTLGVRAVAVGHTPQTTGLRARFEGRIYLIDTGMLSSVYQGSAMALEILGDEFTLLRADGSRVRLPGPPAMGDE